MLGVAQILEAEVDLLRARLIRTVLVQRLQAMIRAHRYARNSAAEEFNRGLLDQGLRRPHSRDQVL